MGFAAVLGAYLGGGGFTTAFGFSMAALGLQTLGQKKTKVGQLRDRATTSQISSEGVTIPKTWGEDSVFGNVIWSTSLEEISNSGSKKSATTNYTYQATFAVLGGQGPIDYLKEIWLNQYLVFSYDGTTYSGLTLTHNAATGTYTGTHDDGWTIAVYTGTSTQLPDPDIEADKGVGRTPAYRDRWYVVFKDLPVTELFGNAIPQVRMVAYNSTVAVSDIIEEISGMVNANPSDLNLAALSGMVVNGFTIDNVEPAQESVSELMRNHFFLMPEVDGKLTAIPKGEPSTATLTANDERVHQPGESYPETTLTQHQSTDIPEVVEITGKEKSRRFEPGTRRARRQVTSNRRKEEMTTREVLTGPQMERLCKQRLREAWTQQYDHALQLGVKHLYLTAADNVTLSDGTLVTLPGLQTPLFGPITTVAPRVYPGDYDIALGPDTEGLPQGQVFTVGTLSYVFIDSVSPEDGRTIERPGFWIAQCTPTGTPFIGPWWKSPSGDFVYTVMPSYRATIGNVVGTLDAWGLGANIFDDDTVLTVDIIGGTFPTSTTEDALLDNPALNRAWVGNELIAFQTATDMGDVSGKRRFALTHLLRGTRGSENFCSSHGSGESFVLYSDAVEFAEIKTTSINTTIDLNAKPRNAPEIDVTFTPRARNMWAYGPTYITGARDGSENLDISWTRRSKLHDLSLTNGAPLADAIYDIRSYRVQIMSGGSVIRTLPTVTTEAAQYSSADQVSDFGSAQASVTVRIYQQNSVVGWGHYGEATV